MDSSPHQTPPGASDSLVLTFTQGVSLRHWDENGSLEREWALYERLARVYARIVFVTWGDAGDLAVLDRLRPRAVGRLEVISNLDHAPDSEYPARAATKCAAALLGDTSVLVKTNQHADGGLAMAIATACRASGIKAGLVARGGYPYSRFAAWQFGTGSREALDAGRREGELCRAADVVIGTTREMLDDLAWRHGIPTEKLALIPNYVIAPPGATARRNGRDVLSAGRLVRQKRFDVLVRAAAMLGADNVAVTVVGDGPEREPLEHLARELHAPVTFVGRLAHADLLARMGSCAVYCQPSEYEGHPKTVLEAMRTGAPVVVASTPGLREVVEHARTGLVTALDARALSEAISRLLRDRPLAERLGDAAREFVQTHCSLDRTVGLELESHHAAMARAGEGAAKPGVGFDPTLASRPSGEASDAWANGLDAFARRRSPREALTFLLALDQRLYDMSGRYAIGAEPAAHGKDRIHPKHRLMRYHDFFVDRVSSADRVLDLGCGVGAVALAVAGRTGAHVTGMDWSQANLDKAQRLLQAGDAAGPHTPRCTWINGDITSDRAAGEFSVVILSNVLEHLKDRPELLSKYCEWYHAERFLIRVPAFDRDWRVPLKRELGVEWRLDETHEIEYSEAVLRQELAQAGLEVTECTARWGEYWVSARIRPR